MNMHSTFSTQFDQSELRDVLGRFATGVAVITTCGNEDEPVGLVVNSFAPVSLDPPEILWSIVSDAPSRDAFESHGAFAVNIMPEECKDQTLQFARPSENKFEGIAWRRGWRLVPVLDKSIATLECDIKQMIPSGDHHIIVGSVQSIFSCQGNPLVFYGGQFTSLKGTV